MTANTKAILATVAAIICFATVMSYPGFFFVLLFLCIAGSAIYFIYLVFLDFFNKKVK